jgi:DNA-binding response OmpR family regulator
MDILCPRCGTPASPAGHEDARAFYQCEICKRVWMTQLVAGTSGRTPGPAPTRVLVVDDSDQVVGLIEAWLEDEGYLVSTATTGSTAIATAAAERPDIVLLDLVLPPPDGFSICETLRRGRNPPIVIVMTGVSDPARLRRVDELGVFAVLPKPLTQETILDVVSRARRRRWQDTPRSAAI